MSTHRAVRLLVLSAIFLMMGARQAHPWCPWGTFHGQVAESETGRPIEGAVVAVMWFRQIIIPIGPDKGNEIFHSAQEALTDAQGQFSLPNCAGIDWNPFTYFKRPDIVIFKPGYEHYIGSNDVLLRGTRVYLRPLRTYKEMLENSDLAAIGIRASAYESVPTVTRLVNEERKALNLQPIGSQ